MCLLARTLGLVHLFVVALGLLARTLGLAHLFVVALAPLLRLLPRLTLP